jgi:hypothetical protein
MMVERSLGLGGSGAATFLRPRSCSSLKLITLLSVLLAACRKHQCDATCLV